MDDQQQQPTLPLEAFSLSIQQTAETEHCGRTTVYERLARGEYDAVKDGPRTRVLIASIKRRRENLPRATFKPLPKRPNHQRRKAGR